MGGGRCLYAMECRYYANSGVRRILYGVPRGRLHGRLVIEFEDGSILVLSEATVANIVRAYITVLTHPLVEAVELVKRRLVERKKGYAEYQLVESGEDFERVRDEISKVLGECRLYSHPDDSVEDGSTGSIHGTF